MNFAAMQEEHGAWIKENFPEQPLWHSLLGICEEVGEAAHAVLKMSQAELYGQEPRYKDRDWMAELADAVGDIMIYLTGAFSNVWFSVAKLVVTVKTSTSEISSDTVYIGALSHWVGEALFFSNLTFDCALNIVRWCKMLCIIHGLDFDAAVETTWKKVQLRRRNEKAQPG